MGSESRGLRHRTDTRCTLRCAHALPNLACSLLTQVMVLGTKTRPETHSRNLYMKNEYISAADV